MKSCYKIQILILFLFFKVNGQNHIENIIDSCKTICENKINKQIKLSKLDYSVKYNAGQSYVRIDFIDESIESKKIEISKINQIKPLLDANKYSFDYSFVYDFVYKGYAIHKVNLKCDKDDFIESTAFFNSLLINIKKGKIVGLDKINKIAKANNFTNVYSYEIDEDPRWKGNNFYEEDEKKWKITWTLKEKNILKDGRQSGYKVIKIDAKNGKVLSKFLEFPID